jgi:hypothetical protein
MSATASPQPIPVRSIETSTLLHVTSRGPGSISELETTVIAVLICFANLRVPRIAHRSIPCSLSVPSELLLCLGYAITYTDKRCTLFLVRSEDLVETRLRLCCRTRGARIKSHVEAGDGYLQFNLSSLYWHTPLPPPDHDPGFGLTG